METMLGTLEIELAPDRAPETVRYFLGYVDAGFYDGTIIHRVVPGFVIQGGGYTVDFRRQPTRAPIRNEADNGVRSRRGTIAMARAADVHSATSQFFIKLRDNRSLDHGVRDFGYAVFGRVIRGMEVVDRIAALPTGPGGPLARDVSRPLMVIRRVDRRSSQP